MRTTPLLPPQFQAWPSLREGKVEQYDIQPSLPKGMRLDVETGAISGLPEHRFHSVYRQTFEVFGYNPVGVCSCKVWLEVDSSNWNLVHIKLCTVGDQAHNVEDSWLPDCFSEFGQTMTDPSPLSFRSPTGFASEQAINNPMKDDKDFVLATVKSHGNNPTPAYLNRVILAEDTDADWNSALDKVAVILERFGTARMIREPCLKLIKGMTASSLLPHLGLSDDPHNARTLVRLLDHRGRNRRDHPLGGAGSLGRGPGVDVAVASMDDVASLSSGDAIVYLRPASIVSLPPPPKLPVPALGEISGLSWEPSAYRVAVPREVSNIRTQAPAGLNQCR